MTTHAYFKNRSTNCLLDIRGMLKPMARSKRCKDRIKAHSILFAVEHILLTRDAI
jgi:hypothetical protein